MLPSMGPRSDDRGNSHYSVFKDLCKPSRAVHKFKQPGALCINNVIRISFKTGSLSPCERVSHFPRHLTARNRYRVTKTGVATSSIPYQLSLRAVPGFCAPLNHSQTPIARNKRGTISSVSFEHRGQQSRLVGVAHITPCVETGLGRSGTHSPVLSPRALVRRTRS